MTYENNALDLNKFAVTILIGLSEAFDCVSHGRSFTKLKACDLTDEAGKFMSGYLSGRFQGECLSNEKKIMEAMNILSLILNRKFFCL